MSEIQCSICKCTVPATETIINTDDEINYQILCKLCNIDLKNEAMRKKQAEGTK